MTVREAINIAVEKGGYVQKLGTRNIKSTDWEQYTKQAWQEFSELKALHDPLLGESLGKTMGLAAMPFCQACHRQSNYTTHCGCCNGKGIDTWLYRWHGFIDHLAEGKEAEEFFKDLR